MISIDWEREDLSYLHADSYDTWFRNQVCLGTPMREAQFHRNGSLGEGKGEDLGEGLEEGVGEGMGGRMGGGRGGDMGGGMPVRVELDGSRWGDAAGAAAAFGLMPPTPGSQGLPLRGSYNGVILCFPTAMRGRPLYIVPGDAMANWAKCAEI